MFTDFDFGSKKKVIIEERIFAPPVIYDLGK